MVSEKRATRRKSGAVEGSSKILSKKRGLEVLPGPSEPRVSSKGSDPKRFKRNSTKSISSAVSDGSGASRYTDLGRIEKERRNEWDKLRPERASATVHPRMQPTSTGKRVTAAIATSPEVQKNVRTQDFPSRNRRGTSQRLQMSKRPTAPAIMVPLSPESIRDGQRSLPLIDDPNFNELAESATPIASQEEMNFDNSTFEKQNVDETDDIQAPLKTRKNGRSPRPGIRSRLELSPAPHDTVDKKIVPETPEPPASRRAETGMQPNGYVAPRQAPETQPVSMSNAVLRRFMEQLEEAMKGRFAELEKSLTDEFRSFRDGLRVLSKDLSDIRALISTAPGSGVMLKNNTPWSIFEKKLEDATPHAFWVFDDSTMSRVLRSNVPMTLFSTALEKEGVHLEQYAAVGIRTLLFGLQPNQGKSAFRKGVGKRHSLFRHAILRNAIYNAQINSFKKFKPLKHNRDDSEDASSQASREPDVHVNMNRDFQANAFPNQITQPPWLRPNVILDTDTRKAQAILETTIKETESTDGPGSGNSVRPNRLIPKEVPSERDIAVFGAQKIYRIATSCLHEGRRLARDAFFRALGYIMVPWGPHTDSVDQQSLRVYKRFPDQPPSQCDVKTIAQTSRKEQVNGIPCDDYNMNIYRSMVKEHPEMILAIRHDVFVTSTGGARTKKGVVRQICRLVNLIDVAMEFCIEYTLIGGERLSPMRARQQYLQGHPDAMRSIYCVALVLKEIVESFLKNCTDDDCALISVSHIDLSKIRCGSLDVSALIPGDSQVKRILNSSCARMSSQVFAEEHVDSDPTNETMNEEDQDGEPSTIQPSNQSGVFAL